MAGATNSNPAIAARARRSAFTLIELLVCVAIITILLSIAFPVINAVRTSAYEPMCQNNLRQLMLGFRAFAQEHTDQLPGGFWDLQFKTDPDSSHWDWLRGNASQWSSAPAGGTLFNYVSRAPTLYRCPALDVRGSPASAIAGAGAGSNGHYDYVSMLDLTGARLANVKPMSRLTYPNGSLVYVATPVIVEGDPAFINGYQFKSWHAGSDPISHTHHGGSFYASIDSSVSWIDEPTGGCWNWQGEAPSGKWVSFGPYPFYWGQWNRQ